MKVLVVDDEPLARRRLAALLHETGLVQAIDEAGDGQSALQQVREFAPDVVFLDVRMPGMDGLEAASELARLEQPPQIVFTTAYDEHALAAFESQALAYLLKPVRSEKLLTALKRAAAMQLGRRALDSAAQTGEGRQHVSAEVGGVLRLMPISEVRYFRADQGYVAAVSADSELLIEDPLKTLEEEFSRQFIRIHRNALVNHRYIEALRRDAEGNTRIKLNGCDDDLMVSRRMLQTVKQYLRQH